jgi:hypothetical protein
MNNYMSKNEAGRWLQSKVGPVLAAKWDRII